MKISPVYPASTLHESIWMMLTTTITMTMTMAMTAKTMTMNDNEFIDQYICYIESTINTFVSIIGLRKTCHIYWRDLDS